MNLEMKEMLTKLAAREAWYDDYDCELFGRCGGNVDDAYSGGCDDGEIMLARELLKKFGDT